MTHQSIILVASSEHGSDYIQKKYLPTNTAWLDATKKPAKGGLVGAVRDLLHTTQTTAWTGQRAVVILHAEKLTIPAANTLLKSLEEPPNNTQFYLITKTPRALLPTILSRCVVVRLDHDNLPSRVVGRLPLVGGEKLSITLRESGPSAELRRAYLRLRDYYKIVAARGNAKLAQDVFEAATLDVFE